VRSYAVEVQYVSEFCQHDENEEHGR